MAIVAHCPLINVLVACTFYCGVSLKTFQSSLVYVIRSQWLRRGRGGSSTWREGGTESTEKNGSWARRHGFWFRHIQGKDLWFPCWTMDIIFDWFNVDSVTVDTLPHTEKREGQWGGTQWWQD